MAAAREELALQERHHPADLMPYQHCCWVATSFANSHELPRVAFGIGKLRSVEGADKLAEEHVEVCATFFVASVRSSRANSVSCSVAGTGNSCEWKTPAPAP